MSLEYSLVSSAKTAEIKILYIIYKAYLEMSKIVENVYCVAVQDHSAQVKMFYSD